MLILYICFLGDSQLGIWLRRKRKHTGRYAGMTRRCVAAIYSGFAPMSCLSIPRVTLVSIFTQQNSLSNVHVAHHISPYFDIYPNPFFLCFSILSYKGSCTWLINIYVHSLRRFNIGKLVLSFWFRLHVMWGLCIWWRVCPVVEPFVHFLLDELFWAIKLFDCRAVFQDSWPKA